MPLRITLVYQGAEKVREFAGNRLTVGRPGATDQPDLDLSPDSFVSRQHAVIEFKNGACWVTDTGSRSGTQINGREIRLLGEIRLGPDDTMVMGETTLRINGWQEIQPSLSAPKPAGLSRMPAPAPQPLARAVDAPKPAPEAPPAPVSPQAPASLRLKTPKLAPSPKEEPPTPAPAPPSTPLPRILHTIDTARGVCYTPGESATVAERRLALLLDLPRELSGRTGRNELLQVIMDRVVKVLPSARRGALLLRDPQQDALLLRAYVSADEPAVSETLARRALDEKRGFIWRWNSAEDTSESMRELKIVSGMFAPVQWQGKVFGVICVDSPIMTDTFHETDLEFLLALGQYAGMALAEQQVQADLERNSKLLQRLLANFSPQVRDVLIEHARLGKLRPGGTKSMVTILFCDICNFTERASQMDPQDVVDMLNDYFQPLMEGIFRHDGTVDKFMGDGLLAVFGSPEPDPQQQQKAVRAALALQQAVEATSQLRAKKGDVACKVRIGVHCGEVFHGFVGTTDRLEFTVIGDAVNRACRYCEGAKEGEILISQDIFQRVFNLVKAEKTVVQSKTGEMIAYRLAGLKA